MAIVENLKKGDTKFLLLGFLGVFAVGLLGSFLHSAQTASSFAVGFLGCIIICAGSLAYMAARLRNGEQNTQNAQDFQNLDSQKTQNAQDCEDSSEQASKNIDKISFSSKFIAGLKISLSGFRIFGYALFVALVVLLVEIGAFEPFGVLLGVGLASLSIVCALAWMFFRK